VGFSANSKLQKVDVVAGGQPQFICDIQGRSDGTWNSEGVIVFDQGTKPLQRVSAASGIPAPVLSLDATRGERNHQTPWFLPDGQHFVYFSAGGTMLASLDGKLNRILIEDENVAIYAPNPRGGGSILYNPQGQLLARPFDPDKLEFTGQAAVIADDVGHGRWWSASANGLLAFRHLYAALNQFTWVGRDGHSMSTVGDPGPVSAPRISPDQKTIVFTRISEPTADISDIWTFDLARNTSTRLTFEPDIIGTPIWSSDGSILYASLRNGASVLVERPANAIGPETILARQAGGRPTAVSRDGRWLVFMESSPLHSIIALRSREDPSKIVRIQEGGLERDGSVSPDGRWLLYSLVTATRREVLVQSVPKEAGGSPNAGRKWEISTAGGSQPAWRADGKEIFYVAPDGMMMAVPVESSANFFRHGTPKPLFQARLDLDPNLRQYDVTADGQRFLLNQRLPDNQDAPITVVVNWPKLLQK
jgi:Tol biopolymer transport system component